MVVTVLCEPVLFASLSISKHLTFTGQKLPYHIFYCKSPVLPYATCPAVYRPALSSYLR